jgi:hypothetical protein
MYSVRIGYEGYEVMLMFRDEKSARVEYDALISAQKSADEFEVFVKDGFKREAMVKIGAAVSVTFTDEEAATMARAEVQLIDARAMRKAQKRFQDENPMQGFQLPGNRMNQ